MKGFDSMIKGRKVYDPLTNKWSTGYWVVDDKGNYYPVWCDQKGVANDRHSTQFIIIAGNRRKFHIRSEQSHR